MINPDPDLSSSPRLSRPLLIGGVIAAVAAAAGLYAATHSGGGDAETAAPATQTQAVSIATVSETEIVRRLTLTGIVQPRREVRVFSPTSGVRALELLVDEGAYVRLGQPLARLDAALATAQTAEAAAAVKEAEVDAQRARAEAARAESVRGAGVLSDEAIATRQAAAEAAAARLAAVQARLNEVEARLQGGYVRAPAAGLVIERPAEAGQLVDGQVLFRIAADNALEVAVAVSEADMLALDEGQAAQFVMADGTPVAGRLRRLPAALDPQTRTGEALFALNGADKLRAGMYLRGEATLSGLDALAVPQTAVVFDAREAYVYTVDEQNVARHTVVTLGPRDGDLVAVTQGLSAGQRVVASGAAFIRDGDAITPIELRDRAAPPAAAAAVSAASGG